MHPTDDSDLPPAGAAARRMPRRLARLVHIDTAVLRVMETHLDRIDRKAPLPRHAVDAVNAALRRAAPLTARLPRTLRPVPFPRENPVRPADAFIALLKIRDAIEGLAAPLLAPAAPEPDDPPF